MNFPSVGVLLVNYNGHKDTISCIESLSKISYTNYKIFIIDNNSSESDYNFLREYIVNNKLDIELIRLNENLGFAGGNNVGIKKIIYDLNYEYVLLLNNDTIVNNNFLNELVDVVNTQENIGIVTSKIYYYPEKEKIWYAGGNINWRKFTSNHFGEKQIDIGQFNSDKEVNFVSGCVMLIKNEVIEKVGYLPEEYFMYYEDFDYCIKVKDAGFILMYAHKSKVYHKISSSTGGEESAFSLEYGTRNRKKLINKYKKRIGILNYIISMSYFYITRVLKIAKFYLKSDKDKVDAIINGLKK